jgi:hypothetical protein
VKKIRWIACAASVCLFALLSCGGGSSNGVSGNGLNPGSSQEICNCTPSAPDSSDFRHAEKHVPPPGSSGQEITVGTMLGWPVPPNPAADAPRSGRELQMFHIAHAFIHFVWLVGSDCDVHVEISDSSDPNAPRVIVETPIDPSFCPARQTIQQQLAANNVPITGAGFELATPLPVEVLGLAFQDFNHARGTTHVATVWEIHPAIVNVLQ